MSFEANQENETTTQVKPPAEFKAGSKWKPFKEGAQAYLSSFKGAHNIPLAYVKFQILMWCIKRNIID